MGRDDLDLFVLRHHARKRKRVHRHRRRRRVGIAAGLLGGVAIIVTLAGFGAGAALSSSCNLSSLKTVRTGANTFVYAADGSLLGSIPAERNREPVDLGRMSQWLPKATVSVEDRRFYQHGGIDYLGIARALWTDIGAGKVVEGGSTITQQLVRNLTVGPEQTLYVGREQTLDRKIKEACLAIKLSVRWSKRRILTTYLNTVYYGNHAYGVEAAAQTYFSVHAKDLDLAQSALLAGLPQAPSDYDPIRNPSGALARRTEVLRAMLASQAITRRQYREAVHAELQLREGKLYSTIRQPYFFTYVIDELTRVYGANTVREGGLKVYTTIEPRLQTAAIAAIKDTLYYGDDPAAAIVSVEPGTGAIRAMTDVIPGNHRNQFNLAAQSARQAGSTFKSFVLAAAIQQGMDPDSTYYMSAPFTCTTGPWCANDYAAGKPWQVATYDHSYGGYTSITHATLRSDNTVYAQLTLDVGPANVWRLARSMGVHLTQKPVASIGLGSLSVSPLEMAAAYATFAAGGVYARPTGIRKVVFPNGKTDQGAAWGRPQTHRVLSQGVAWKVNQVLGENALYGTGAGSGDGLHPNAGKTGTTTDHADAWFVGYTRDYSTAVWMGYPKGEIPMLSVHGQSVAGATFPVPIWHRFMSVAEEGHLVKQFLTPNAYPAYRYFTKGYWGYLATQPTTTVTTTTVKPVTVQPPTPLQVGIALVH